jgi:hypothetical protein
MEKSHDMIKSFVAIASRTVALFDMLQSGQFYSAAWLSALFVARSDERCSANRSRNKNLENTRGSTATNYHRLPLVRKTTA